MKKLQGVSAYQDISAGSGIDSASPRRLVQMLLDGALNRIATAKGHIQRQESARKGEQIGKAISIIDGLRVSLNPEAGELSENLGNLYEYISGRLLEANLNDNVAVLDEARLDGPVDLNIGYGCHQGTLEAIPRPTYPLPKGRTVGNRGLHRRHHPDDAGDVVGPAAAP